MSEGLCLSMVAVVNQSYCSMFIEDGRARPMSLAGRVVNIWFTAGAYFGVCALCGTSALVVTMLASSIRTFYVL